MKQKMRTSLYHSAAILALLVMVAASVSSSTRTALAQGTTTTMLTVTKAGTGAGTVTSVPGGISCGTACTSSFQPYQFLPPASSTPTVVTLTAQPGDGSVFAGWGGDCTGAGTCSLGMGSNRSVTATFTLQAAGATTSQGTTPPVPLPVLPKVHFVPSSTSIMNPAPGFGALSLNDTKTAILAKAKVRNIDTRSHVYVAGIKFDETYYEHSGSVGAGKDVDISWVLKGNTKGIGGGYVFAGLDWTDRYNVKAQWYLCWLETRFTCSSGDTTNIEVRKPDLTLRLTPPAGNDPSVLDLTNLNAVVRFTLTAKNGGTAPTPRRVKAYVDVEDPNWWQYYDQSHPNRPIEQSDRVLVQFPVLGPGQEASIPFEVSVKKFKWLLGRQVQSVTLNAMVNSDRVSPEADWFNNLADGRVTVKHRPWR